MNNDAHLFLFVTHCFWLSVIIFECREALSTCNKDSFIIFIQFFILALGALIQSLCRRQGIPGYLPVHHRDSWRQTFRVSHRKVLTPQPCRWVAESHSSTRCASEPTLKKIVHVLVWNYNWSWTFKLNELLVQNPLTVSHHSLQANDVRVVKLGHYRCLCQEILLLLLCVSCLQSLQCNCYVSFPWEPHTSVTHLPELPWTEHKSSALKR